MSTTEFHKKWYDKPIMQVPVMFLIGRYVFRVAEYEDGKNFYCLLVSHKVQMVSQGANETVPTLHLLTENGVEEKPATMYAVSPNLAFLEWRGNKLDQFTKAMQDAERNLSTDCLFNWNSGDLLSEKQDDRLSEKS